MPGGAPGLQTSVGREERPGWVRFPFTSAIFSKTDSASAVSLLQTTASQDRYGKKMTQPEDKEQKAAAPSAMKRVLPLAVILIGAGLVALSLIHISEPTRPY